MFEAKKSLHEKESIYSSLVPLIDDAYIIINSMNSIKTQESIWKWRNISTVDVDGGQLTLIYPPVGAG